MITLIWDYGGRVEFSRGVERLNKGSTAVPSKPAANNWGVERLNKGLTTAWGPTGTSGTSARRSISGSTPSWTATARPRQ
eukprot:848276-Prorocentrum_minimum.AAC.1